MDFKSFARDYLCPSLGVRLSYQHIRPQMRLHFYLIFALPVSLLFEDTLDRFTFVGPLLKAFVLVRSVFELIRKCSSERPV